MLEGGEVTRNSAYHDFGIQNLTVRLSELTGLGFDIIHSKISAKTKAGKTIKIITWKLRHVFQPGDYVKVINDTGSFLSLHGKTGKVLRVSQEEAALVLEFPGLGIRRVAYDRLAQVEYLPSGTKVRLDTGGCFDLSSGTRSSARWISV